VPSTLRLHFEDHIARVELSQPDGYPRLGMSLLEELAAHLDRLLADLACHGLVLHGSDDCFAVGAEIAEVGNLTSITALDFARRTQLLFDRIACAPKPVVAAVAGYCLGGGFDLALACHVRLATPDAVFGHPGPTLGLLTGWSGTQRLPQLLGRAGALELLLPGHAIEAREALRLGVVDEIVPAQALLSRASSRARRDTRADDVFFPFSRKRA
jgi:enoyl-CoA hydratase/carnithine racemase